MCSKLINWGQGWSALQDADLNSGAVHSSLAFSLRITMRSTLYRIAIAALLATAIRAQDTTVCTVVPFASNTQGFEYAANFTQLGTCSTADFK